MTNTVAPVLSILQTEMDAIQALDQFLRAVLELNRADRYCDLIKRPKGQKCFLRDLYHIMEVCFRAELPNRPLSEEQLAHPGYSYSESRGFGVAEATLRAGYDALMPNTGWLLVEARGRYGIYQPEDMIDDQCHIVP